MNYSLDYIGNWASELFSWFYRQLSQWAVLLILQATEPVNCSLDSTGNWASEAVLLILEATEPVSCSLDSLQATEPVNWFYRQLLILQATALDSTGNWASELFSWFYRQLSQWAVFLFYRQLSQWTVLLILILQATEPVSLFSWFWFRQLDSSGNSKLFSWFYRLDSNNWASELFSWFYRQLTQWIVLLILYRQLSQWVNCSLDSTGNWANVLFSWLYRQLSQ